jgi:membrane-associated protease RseP (regulator of RpoE activity)
VTYPTPSPAPLTRPNTRKVAGIASLSLGVLAAIPLGSFLGAQVAAASVTSVQQTLLWGTAVVTIGTVALIGGIPVALLAIAFGFTALVRNGRVGKGCGLSGFLLGAVVLVWLAIAVFPQVGMPY